MNRELIEILISWMVISLCFSMSSLFYTPSFFISNFIIYATTAGIGFLFHEIAHKVLAERLGYRAYYRIWPVGIIMALLISIISKGSFVFAALGAVYIVPVFIRNNPNESYGKIALSGPLVNLILAFVFLFVNKWIGLLYVGYEVNSWLAAFNLLPFYPLDGSKVFSWSKFIWAIFAIIAWIMVLF